MEQVHTSNIKHGNSRKESQHALLFINGDDGVKDTAEDHREDMLERTCWRGHVGEDMLERTCSTFCAPIPPHEELLHVPIFSFPPNKLDHASQSDHCGKEQREKG